MNRCGYEVERTGEGNDGMHMRCTQDVHMAALWGCLGHPCLFPCLCPSRALLLIPCAGMVHKIWQVRFALLAGPPYLHTRTHARRQALCPSTPPSSTQRSHYWRIP